MAYEKLYKNLSQIETRKLGIGLFAGFLLSLTYLSPSIFHSLPFSNVNLQLSSILAAPISLGVKNATLESKSGCGGSSPRRHLCEKIGFIRLNGSSSSPNTSDHDHQLFVLIRGTNISTQLPLGNRKESKVRSQIFDNLEDQTQITDRDAIVSKNSSTTTRSIGSIQKVFASNKAMQSDEKRADVKPKKTTLKCDFSNPRSNLCEMDGDIRVHGKSYSVVFVTSSESNISKRNESWRIRPYARKTDLDAMANVREIIVKSSMDGQDQSPRCAVNHSVPAIIFSVAGYTGNYFHDFTDVFVPLFLTSHQFNMEVQFLVTDYKAWWINKYIAIFNKLSRYEIIDLDNDDRVHCFPTTIVGLNSHDDLRIDPSRSPNGYSMADFTKLLRSAYSLPRESPLTTGAHFRKKPRLMIIARSRTRKFTNVNKIVRMAEKLGFEVVVGEAETNVTRFASIVNSCDVMMGVHGAGLTNLVFLPTSAVLIQIVPWGRLHWIANTDFGEPAKDMNLRYLDYVIREEESTLVGFYPRDHAVFKDPLSIHKLGWKAMKEIYLVKQNVKLNVRRFRGVLMKALKLLHKQ